VTAAVLVGVAVAALVVVLTDPYTQTDANIPYALIAAVLGGTAFFAGLALAERGPWLFGQILAVAALGGFAVLFFAIWNGAVLESRTEGALWAGLVTLVTTLAFATRLLAHATVVRWIAGAAGALAFVAAAVSLDAALTDDQFWRVGTTITSLWILAALLAFSVPLVERALTRSTLWLVPLVPLVGIAVAGVVAVERGEFSPQGYSIFFTLIAAVLTAAALLGGLLAVERGALVVGWTALAIAPPALALAVYGIWVDTDDRFRLIWSGVAIVLALLVALPARLSAIGEDLTRLATAAALAAGAAALVGIWNVWREGPTLGVEQAAAALWIVAVLCGLLVPVLEHYRAQYLAQASEAGA
jgi:hypothetical protein